MLFSNQPAAAATRRTAFACKRPASTMTRLWRARPISPPEPDHAAEDEPTRIDATRRRRSQVIA
jgi:hypothetical protein